MITDPHPDQGRALGRLEKEQGRTIQKGAPKPAADSDDDD